MADIPETIGRYRVEAVLGRGAMGVVYKGHDPEIDRPVAIKLVRADLLSGAERDEYLARFRQEARAAGRCAHPNIVAIYDFALYEGNPFLTMEYVEGISLAQAFEHGTAYPPAEAIGMMLQVLDALGYAHERGIVHRDIKPANIMVLQSGRVKVGDFGISRLPGSELTLAGSIIGTPSYMSPEQCRGDEVDQRTDLFSTGTVLFQLLTGEKPFPGNSVTEIVYRLMNEDPPDLQAKGVLVPAAVSAALRRSLDKRPEERFATAREMAEALRLGLGVSETDERTVVVRDAHVLVSFENHHTGEAAPPPATTAVSPPPRPEATAAAASPAPEAAPGTISFGSAIRRFDVEVLTRIERSLAQYVGPMARLLVRNAAARADTTADLCAGLARHIATPSERAEFLTRIRELSQFRQASRSGEAPATAAAAADALLSADDLARVQRDLAAVLGPIARLLVQRAAAGAASERDLREKLAEHIKSDAERRAFLAGGGRTA
jgi:eukaryotic-like serine/threonine-protein kinase